MTLIIPAQVTARFSYLIENLLLNLMSHAHAEALAGVRLQLVVAIGLLLRLKHALRA